MGRPVVVDSSDESSSESDSSSSRSSNDLIDDEAADSDDSNDEASSVTVDIPPSDQFPRFMDFPVEIRRYIWDFFCPDVASKHPRVLQLGTRKLRPELDLAQNGAGWAFCDGLATQDQTEQLRRLASVHQETRDIVTKAFPDVVKLLGLPANGEIRFNSERDIILTDVDDHIGQHIFNHRLFKGPPCGRFDTIKHICFNWKHRLEDLYSSRVEPTVMVQALVRDMPNIETIMFAIEAHPGDGLYRNKEWGWVAEEQTVEARVNTFEKSPGLGEDLEWIYVWPDFKNHPHFLNQLPDLAQGSLPHEYTELILKTGAKYVPMVVFDFDNLDYLEQLKARYESRPWSSADLNGEFASEDDSQGSDYGDEEVENEYESEGIDDDDEVEQWDDHDENELIPPPISPPGGAISVSSDEDVERAGPTLHLPQQGNFSSPEPESENEQEAVPRRPKRRIVSDSDDEDADEPPVKRTKTQAVSVSSDDEDEEPRPRAGSRGVPQVISDDEDDSSTEGSSEDDDAQPKKLSLQQRLRSAPSGHVQSEDDNDSSEDANSFCSYANSEDDEEDEDSEEDGLVDRMAGDTDDDDGNGESDDGW